MKLNKIPKRIKFHKNNLGGWYTNHYFSSSKGQVSFVINKDNIVFVMDYKAGTMDTSFHNNLKDAKTYVKKYLLDSGILFDSEVRYSKGKKK